MMFDRSSLMRWKPILGAVLMGNIVATADGLKSAASGAVLPPGAMDKAPTPPGGELPPDLSELYELLGLPKDLSKPKASNDAALMDVLAGLDAPSAEDTNMVGYITFVDESPYQVIQLLQRFTGETVLMGPDLPNVKINYSSSRELTQSQAITEIISILSNYGIAIMRRPYEVNGEILQQFAAVPSAAIASQAPQVIMELPIASSSGEYFSYYFPLKYIAMPDAEAAIQRVLTPNGSSLFPVPKLGKILVTDKLYNLVYIRDLLAVLDQPSNVNEGHFFFDLTYAKASDVQTSIKSILEGGYANNFHGNVVINIDARSNRLIVVTHPTNIPKLKSLIDGLDADTASLLQTECISLHYTSAEKLVPIIKELISGQKQGKTDAPKEGLAKAEPVKADTASSSEFSQHVTVVADERGNKVVASGTSADIKQIRKLIEGLDVRLPQVRIEVIITEVKLTDQSQRGLNAFSIGKNYPSAKDAVVTPGTNSFIQDVSMSAIAANGAGSPFVLNGRFFDRPFDMNMVFQQAQTNSNVRILSTPTIVTTHNREASIEVTSQRPIVKDSLSSDKDNSTPANNTSIRSTIEYKDIGIILKVKPLIGLNGTIQLEIDQEISTSTDNANINGILQPIISKRQAKSFVSAQDQEVIILGGLRQNEITNNKGKLFLLGDIPVLGSLLFSPKTKVQSTSELIIFIKPHIMMPDEMPNTKPMKSATEQTAEIIDISENRDNVLQFLDTGTFPPITVQDMNRFGSTLFEEKEPKPKPALPTSEIPQILEDNDLPPVVPDSPKNSSTEALPGNSAVAPVDGRVRPPVVIEGVQYISE